MCVHGVFLATLNWFNIEPFAVTAQEIAMPTPCSAQHGLVPRVSAAPAPAPKRVTGLSIQVLTV